MREQRVRGGGQAERHRLQRWGCVFRRYMPKRNVHIGLYICQRRVLRTSHSPGGSVQTASGKELRRGKHGHEERPLLQRFLRPDDGQLHVMMIRSCRPRILGDSRFVGI